MLQKIFKKVNYSYGAIIISEDDHGEGVILLEQRRDSYAYTGFLCGDYQPEDLPSYFELMTDEEKERLEWHYMDFDTLWEDLFINPWSERMNELYEFAREKYEQVKYNLPFYLELCEKSTPLPWTFPTGRKNKGQTINQTIIREVWEETRLEIDPRDFVDGADFHRSITGSDGRSYEYVYKLVKLKTPSPIPQTFLETPGRIRSRCFTPETNQARWVTFDQAVEMVDPTFQHVIRSVQMSQILPRIKGLVDIRTIL